MVPKDFDFKLPAKPAASEAPLSRSEKVLKSIQDFLRQKLGADHKITRWAEQIEFGKRDNALDSLSQLKKKEGWEDKLNPLLTMVLILILMVSWKYAPKWIRNIDQLKEDISEQKQVIKMEEQNNDFLIKLDSDRNALDEHIFRVNSAVPEGDERAEEVIAMLEDMALKNRMLIESIGMRELPESQFYYDELIGLVQPYEYTFSLQGDLPNILSFIGALRSSLRLFDIMTLEIEKGKEGFKSNFSVYAYHIIGDDEPEEKTSDSKKN